MDNKESRLEKIFDGLKIHEERYINDGKDDIAEINSSTVNCIDLSDLGSLDPYYGAIPPSSVMAASGSYDLANSVTWPTSTITVNPSTWTGTSGQWRLDAESLVTPQSAKIKLEGKDADIEINGQSLCDMIRGIQDRLNILCPDPGMEAEWDDLRAIREQYESKLAECREKSRAWKALQQKG